MLNGAVMEQLEIGYSDRGEQISHLSRHILHLFSSTQPGQCIELKPSEDNLPWLCGAITRNPTKVRLPNRDRRKRP
jgi:hypothetical protein